jgi:hypothetical protein
VQACDVEAAASSGRVDILDLLHEHNCPMSSGACYAAAKGRHLEALKWLREHDHSWDDGVAVNCAYNGDLEMLQWVVQNKGPWNKSRCFSYAQSHKHKEVAEWIRSNHLKAKKKNK